MIIKLESQVFSRADKSSIFHSKEIRRGIKDLTRAIIIATIMSLQWIEEVKSISSV